MTYDPNEALKLKNQLCFPLYAAARRVTGVYTPYLKPLGLTSCGRRITCRSARSASGCCWIPAR